MQKVKEEFLEVNHSDAETSESINNSNNNKSKKNVVVRWSNWMVVPLLLEHLSTEEVMLSLDFGEDIDDLSVRKKLLDMFLTLQADSDLPPIARSLSGRRLGRSPPGGLDFDSELFKAVFREYIQKNEQMRTDVGHKPTLINQRNINFVFTKLRQQNTATDLPKSYTKHMTQDFRSRWFICGKYGVLKEPIDPIKGQKLNFTKYAIDKKYNLLESNKNSNSNHSDDKKADLYTDGLPALVVRYSFLRIYNPFFPSIITFMRLMGFTSEIICEKHRKPISDAVVAWRQDVEDGDATTTDSIASFCRNMMAIFISCDALNAVRYTNEYSDLDAEKETDRLYTCEDFMHKLNALNVSLSSVDYCYATLLFESASKDGPYTSRTIAHKSMMTIIDDVLLKSVSRLQQDSKAILAGDMARQFEVAVDQCSTNTGSSSNSSSSGNSSSASGGEDESSVAAECGSSEASHKKPPFVVVLKGYKVIPASPSSFSESSSISKHADDVKPFSTRVQSITDSDSSVSAEDASNTLLAVEPVSLLPAVQRSSVKRKSGRQSSRFDSIPVSKHRKVGEMSDTGTSSIVVVPIAKNIEKARKQFENGTLKAWFTKYGKYTRKFNARALVVPGGSYDSASNVSVNTRHKKTNETIDFDERCGTDMWLHILNSHSQNPSFNSTICHQWKTCVDFNIKLNQHLISQGNEHPHSVVEVLGDGTCLINSVLTSLYLMKWFQTEKFNNSCYFITPLHLKKIATSKMAMYCNEPLKADDKETLLSYYRNHHTDPQYSHVHPFSVQSLQQELDNIMRDASNQVSPANDYVYRVACAIHTLRSPTTASVEELTSASIVLDQHVQKFKEHRSHVYSDFFAECKAGTLTSTHAEEMQLKYIWEVLGVTGELYDNETDTWHIFNKPQKSEPGQITVIVMKTYDHYFAVINLDQLTDEYDPSTHEIELCSKVKYIRSYPTVDDICLTNNSFENQIHELVSRSWYLSDSTADIHKTCYAASVKTKGNDSANMSSSGSSSGDDYE